MLVQNASKMQKVWTLEYVKRQLPETVGNQSFDFFATYSLYSHKMYVLYVWNGVKKLYGISTEKNKKYFKFFCQKWEIFHTKKYMVDILLILILL